MATGIDTLDSINATFKQSNKIALIIDEAFKTNSKDRILNLFDELDNVPDMANYDKEAKKEFERLKASSQEIIKEFDEKNRANNIFGHARNQINKDFQGIYNELITNLNNAKDYETIKPLYKDLTDFIKDAILHHNNARRNSYSRYNITMNTDFLRPQEINAIKKENLKQQILDLLSKTTFSANAKSILPKIIYYNNSLRFNNKDLITNIDSIESSEFFNALCNIAKIDISSLKNAYKNSAKSTAYLTAEMEDINKRISRFITQEFNKLYKKNGSDIYEFNFALSQNQISLEIFTNEKKVVKELDLQSSGFQWFFNLFFGLLYGKGLQKDSIVIMDEPAHNLSVPSRKEFRDFLKSYGQDYGITFVVITHDPFLADIDYLDEIRIVQNLDSKNGVEIINDFSSIKSSDTDALRSIKKAFGVDSGILYNRKLRLIFVEGITDYNYLTIFKILLEREYLKSGNKESLNLAFLPIGGLGIKGEEEKILKGLCELHESPILLVDSDKAGAAIKECAKKLKLESLSIIELKEIDSKFKDIESCFDSKDLEAFNIAFGGDSKVDSKGGLNADSKLDSGDISKIDSKTIKGYKESHALKTAILNNKLKPSDTTKANFGKILEYLNDKL
ncbi:hypothetical protein DCO58_11470 [Helicobacter saguini]|uniref:ATPase AAA-type core domain-containing protein n=1 Tax=Helicobacter saguini TaxID=1548018 RepID=A0A347VKD4_9HELI|nr:hypothetical protein [Helicobacter saguini]MWV61092.1 hypothetical protein [Helicobacter saguini]MWV68239.1 hypothetical protein [Helicobacter saguini]MWV70297.1 hypothetical protein [Helicobacter saguini]MWV72199.1 hypothetical protein [Helicobacter saguini]TLD95252.1 hypothetical protein LS64_002510 [Helicobacter saguini]